MSHAVRPGTGLRRFAASASLKNGTTRTCSSRGRTFLSKSGAGSHSIVFGYDGFNDRVWKNNHQSGSDYRILGTTSIVNDGTVTPVFLGGSTIIQWNPISLDSQGTNFRTHSVFFSDQWRVTSRLSANLGLRYDRNAGANSAGDTVANDSAWSPRLGVVWDPTGDGDWSVTTSFARYVAALTNGVANASSAAGNPDTYQFVYRGPSINAGGVAATPTPEAVQEVFDWFFANGGPNLPLTGTPNIPGVTPQIRGSLTSPNVLEYTGGISRQIGNRAAIRADLVYRDYHDFYAARTDRTTGQVTDKLGRAFDLQLIREHRHAQAPIYRSEHTGDISLQLHPRSRWDLHVVAHMGKLRRRNSERRAGNECWPVLSRVQARGLELP